MFKLEFSKTIIVDGREFKFCKQRDHYYGVFVKYQLKGNKKVRLIADVKHTLINELESVDLRIGKYFSVEVGIQKVENNVFVLKDAHHRYVNVVDSNIYCNIDNIFNMFKLNKNIAKIEDSPPLMEILMLNSGYHLKKVTIGGFHSHRYEKTLMELDSGKKKRAISTVANRYPRYKELIKEIFKA